MCAPSLASGVARAPQYSWAHAYSTRKIWAWSVADERLGSSSAHTHLRTVLSCLHSLCECSAVLKATKMPAFSVNFSFLEPQSRKGVYFKQDGQRFGTDRTMKFCTAVKYEIRVTVKPPVAPLR